MSLRRRLAENGFETNDDYEFVLRCVVEQRDGGLRCASVEGESGRRKSAFAQSLAAAMAFKRTVYLDFSKPPVAPPLVVSADADGPVEAPLTPLERVVTEACAYSEAESTILILDQLQLSDFTEQVRIYQFVVSGSWTVNAAAMTANSRNLLVLLISEEPLYHSLLKQSFRIWTDPGTGLIDYKPEEFGLASDAQRFFAAFNQVFELLQSAPTQSEFGKLITDLQWRVRSREQLRQALFGRMERIDRNLLYAHALDSALDQVIDEVMIYLGEETIEVSSPAEI